MRKVSVRVPATTANLGPGFDCFGCALSLYTQVSVEETGEGLRITGCDEAFAGPDNLVYTAYCAVMDALQERICGVRIHIDADIPVCRGLGSSAALLAAGAMAANALHGNRLSRERLLEITNRLEGHPDNLAPAIYGGLTASLVEGERPVCVRYEVHPDWRFLALVPDFTLSTALARQALPGQYSKADAVYNISRGALVLKALETGDEALLSMAMRDRIHEPYRRKLICDYDAIESLVRGRGAAFCLSGAGPTLLCITRQAGLEELLRSSLPSLTEASWRVYPLAVEHMGAQLAAAE